MSEEERTSEQELTDVAVTCATCEKEIGDDLYIHREGLCELPEKVKFIGYGTFMTQALQRFEGAMEGSTYGIPITILGMVEVEGYRRLCYPNSPYPYVIKEEGKSFLGMTFETDRKNVRDLDRVEGVPRHYTRETVTLGDEDYFIYAASAETYRTYGVEAMHNYDLADFWHERVRMEATDKAMETFPELQEERDGASEVKARYPHVYAKKEEPAPYIPPDEDGTPGFPTPTDEDDEDAG